MMSTVVLVGLFGAGGYAREVMPYVESSARRLVGSTRSVECVFVDLEGNPALINGRRVISESNFLSQAGVERMFNVAIASASTREAISAKCASVGAIPLAIHSDNVVILDDVKIGEGAILSPFTTLTSNISIGNYFHANLYSYVAHDCLIGNYVTFAPAVHCNGNIVIEDYVYIGTGAILRNGTAARPLRIGKGAVVGMGAVVTKDVPPGVTVMGNPARLR